MSSKSEYKGKWWIPAVDQNKIDGTLTINPDGTSVLEIRGELINRNFAGFSPSREGIEIIWGRASDGSKLTLFNCDLVGTSHSSEGFPTQSFKINTTILDAYFPTKETITFREVRIEFKHFEYLIKSTRIHVIQIPETNELLIKNILREEIPLCSVDNFIIKIIIEVHPYITTSPIRKISVKESPYILIKTDVERKYDDFLKIIDKLQYFFTFCLLKTVYPVKITGESAVSIWKPPMDWNVTKKNHRVIFEPIEIISHWVDLPDLSQDDEVDRNKILFIMNEIQENSEFIMNKWWIKNDVFKSVFDIYFGTIFNSRMYLENTYLSLAQCIESYHRKSTRYLDYRVHPDEYNERIEFVKDSLKTQIKLTKGQKKSLISTLKNVNTPSLENRIEQLLITYPTISPMIVGNEANFSNTIALNRNHLTHLDPKPGKKYATFEELYYLSLRMRLLLITVFLDELGFDIKKIEKIIERIGR